LNGKTVVSPPPPPPPPPPQTQQITPQLALQVLLQFDKAINTALANRVRNRVNFKGSLNTYRFCDNVWTFVLNDVEFREVTDLVKVDKVKIVACDGKSRLTFFLSLSGHFLFIFKQTRLELDYTLRSPSIRPSE
uniref:Transcription initiation factor IIA subunit 2 n=1 Tax=Oncorhynchus kisutch TaxID=8019 RepID=A0A8C7HSD4_ONCKI